MIPIRAHSDATKKVVSCGDWIVLGVSNMHLKASSDSLKIEEGAPVLFSNKTENIMAEWL